MSVPRERRDVGDEQIPTFRSHIHGIARAEMKATRPTICYRTTIYKNQHRHEPPLFHLGFIQEAEAFSSGRQRQRSGIERDRHRRSRRAATCSSISRTSARSVIRRYAKKNIQLLAFRLGRFRWDTTKSRTDRIRRGQVNPPQGKRIPKRLPSAQVCRERSLLYSGQLRGMASLPGAQSTVFTVVLANRSEPASHRIFGPPGRKVFRFALQARPSG